MEVGKLKNIKEIKKIEDIERNKLPFKSFKKEGDFKIYDDYIVRSPLFLKSNKKHVINFLFYEWCASNCSTFFMGAIAEADDLFNLGKFKKKIIYFNLEKDSNFFRIINRLKNNCDSCLNVKLLAEGGLKFTFFSCVDGDIKNDENTLFFPNSSYPLDSAIVKFYDAIKFTQAAVTSFTIFAKRDENKLRGWWRATYEEIRRRSEEIWYDSENWGSELIDRTHRENDEIFAQRPDFGLVRIMGGAVILRDVVSYLHQDEDSLINILSNLRKDEIHRMYLTEDYINRVKRICEIFKILRTRSTTIEEILPFAKIGCDEFDEEGVFFPRINNLKTFLSESCVVCYNKKPNILFCSCGHICLCKDCYFLNNKNRCPLCKVESKTVKEI